MSHTFIYLFTRLESFHGLMGGLIVLSIVSIVGLNICFFLIQDKYIFGEEIKKKYLPEITKWIKTSIVLLVLCTIFSITIPTTKEAAVIYLLPKVVNNEQCQQIPINFTKLLNTKMETWINEQIGENIKK